MCIAGHVQLYILHLWPPTAPRARALRLVLRTELTSCFSKLTSCYVNSGYNCLMSILFLGGPQTAMSAIYIAAAAMYIAAR